MKRYVIYMHKSNAREMGMGLIDVANGYSVWRGTEYYKNEKVVSWHPSGISSIISAMLLGITAIINFITICYYLICYKKGNSKLL